MYWRCWPATVVVYVPVFRSSGFPHPDEILVDVGPLGCDEVVVMLVTVVEWGPQLPERHW